MDRLTGKKEEQDYLQGPRLKWLLSLCRVLGNCQLSATTGTYSLRPSNVLYIHLSMALGLSGIKDRQPLPQLPAFPALSPFSLWLFSPEISSLLCYRYMWLALLLFPRAGQTSGARDATHLVVTSYENGSVSGCCRQHITHQAVRLIRSLWYPVQQAHHTLEPLSWGHSSYYAVTRREILSGL